MLQQVDLDILQNSICIIQRYTYKYMSTYKYYK